MLLFDQSTMRIIYCVWYVFLRDSCEIFLIHEEQFALVSKSMY